MNKYEFTEILQCCLLMYDQMSDVELNKSFSFKTIDISKEIIKLIQSKGGGL